MKRKSGFTLIELMVVIVIAAIGMLGASFILVSAYNDLRDSRNIKSLQEDLDLASLTIKSVIEEADDKNISDNNEDIEVSYTEDDGNILWKKKFYKSDNSLVLTDMLTEEEEDVINTLSDISFSETSSKSQSGQSGGFIPLSK